MIIPIWCLFMAYMMIGAYLTGLFQDRIDARWGGSLWVILVEAAIWPFILLYELGRK